MQRTTNGGWFYGRNTLLITQAQAHRRVIAGEEQLEIPKIQMDKNARKVRNQDINPCIEESDGSQKCLAANNYDKSVCSAYFQRYKTCRKYWHNIMIQRRRDGIKPDMPTAEERQQILAAIGGKPY